VATTRLFDGLLQPATTGATTHRFSLYDRSECWDDRDLELLQPHAAKVWSLELHGDEIDDAMLDRLPAFPKLEILELRGAPVRGRGLAALGRHPKLRVLRAYLPEGHPSIGWFDRVTFRQ